MADVNIQGGETGSGMSAVLAVVIIALLAVLAWFFFVRSGATDNDADIRVDVNPPAATGGTGGGGGSGGNPR